MHWSSKTPPVAWLTLAGFLLLVPSCMKVRSNPEQPHVVVILIDTLRLDHTSLGGYERDTTPGLREIAAEGLTFTRHFANGPWTRPTVASILTGLLPPGHGTQWGDMTRAQEGGVDLLPTEFDTLPEILRSHGYATHAFVTNPILTEGLGYAQGYDHYELYTAKLEHDRQAVQATKDALDESNAPTFVWCHLMAPHNYETPKGSEPFTHSRITPITSKHEYGHIMIDHYGLDSREQAMDRYDRTVVYADGLVSELVDHIRRKHPDTLVVITSDHGEEFADHGGYLHSRTLYNEIIRVPMVLWGPDIARGETDERLCSSVDVLPTVLDYLDLPQVPTQGRSMLAAEPDPERVVYVEKRNRAPAMRALITRRGKFIETKPTTEPGSDAIKPPMEGEGTFEFFADPVGLDDAPVDAPDELLQQARAQLEEIWSSSRELFVQTTGQEALRGTLTEEDTETLRELGYIE